MKKLITISTIIFFLYSCSTNVSKPQEIKGMEITKGEFNLIMATYKKAWIDGANAATHAANTGQPFGEEIGRELMEKDSLAFVGIISINKIK